MKGINPVKPAGMDQTHEQVSDIGPVLGFEEIAVLVWHISRYR